MQSTSDLLAALSKEGITVSLVGGDKLKVEPRQLVTVEVKQSLGQHKAQIIEALSIGAAKDSTYAKKGDVQIESEPFSPSLEHSRHVSPVPKNVGCFSCGHYDGKGPAWPGMCRYFETIGQAAKEIDFNVVDVVRGCKLFITQSFQAKVDSPCLICGKPLHQDGGDCWHKSFHLGETARPMQRNTQRNAELREQTK